MHYKRRRLLLAGASLTAAGSGLLRMPAHAQTGPLLRKIIPSSGEEIPIIGLGTARRYENAGGALRETLERLGSLGATVIDTAPVYGQAEAVLGDLLEQLELRPRLFLATQVSIGGRAAGVQQIEQSFKRLRTRKIDLIGVHNLRDTQAHLQTLRQLKKDGRMRGAGHGAAGVRRRQPGGGARPAARGRDAPQDGTLH